MSDYLASMIARNLEVADRLQPRAVSSFEPIRDPPEDAASNLLRLEQVEEHIFVEPQDPSPRDVAPAGRSTPQLQKLRATSNAGDERPLTAFLPPIQSDRSQTAVLRNDRDAIHPTAVGRDSPQRDADRKASRAPLTHSTDAGSSTTDATLRVSNAGAPRAHPTLSPERFQPPHPSDKPAANPARPAAARQPQPAAAQNETTRVRIERSIDRPRDDVPSTADQANAGLLYARPIEARLRDGQSTGRSTAIESDARPGLLPRTNEGLAPRRTSEPFDEFTDDMAQVLKPAAARASQSTRLVQVRLLQEVARDAMVPTVAAAEAAPTVHVTIGRIEVRATPEAARPSQSRSQPASSGLSDYLRRRAEGSGR